MAKIWKWIVALLESRQVGAVLAILPPLCLAPMIALWGVDLPYFDQWELIPRFAQWSAGEFPWQAIWQFHNEHRLFVPELIMLGLGALTDWNIRWELAVNYLLAFATFWVLLRAFQQRLGVKLGQHHLVLPVVSLLIFSPSQWGNWSWGWQIQIFLCIFLVVSATFLLTRDQLAIWPFLGAIVCSALAPFSFANGLLFLPLGFLLTLRQPGRAWWRVWSWSLAAGLTIWLYQIPLLKPRFSELNTPSFAERSLAQVDYLLHYLAGPMLTFHPGLLRVAAYGLVPLSLVLSAYLLVQQGRSRLVATLPWATLWAFGLASAMMTAYGRYSFGVAQAISSRYFTIANLYWLGILGLVVLATTAAQAADRDGAEGMPTREKARWSRAFRPTLVLLAALLFCQGVAGAIGFRQDSKTRVWLRANLRGELPSEQVQDPVPLLPYPDKEIVRQRLEILERLQLSVYRRP